MGTPFDYDQRRSWARKFGEAFRGIKEGAAGQVSFLVHLPVAILVLAAAAWLQVSLERWCLLLLCIGIVITAELFNSALEVLGRRVTSEEDPLIAQTLHIASGAVLVASITAAFVGIIVLGDALLPS